MNTAVIKRSIFINGKKTSISLENEFRDALHEIAKYKKHKRSEARGRNRPSMHYRQFIVCDSFHVYNHFRSREGSRKAGRGQTQRHLDSASLRARAEECRALAGESNNEKMRAVMFRIAADYEQMAAMQHDQSAKPKATNFLAANRFDDFVSAIYSRLCE